MKPEPESPADLFAERGLEELLARAERDPAASEELDLVADLVAAAELERGRLAARTAAPPARRARQGWIAAAASVLFVAALALWLARRGVHVAPNLLAERGAPRYVAAELRDPERPSDDAFPRAMERYVAGDHAGAALALAALLAAHPEQGPARFYLAAAREQLGELESAAADYRRVAEEQTGLLAEHARWRLANLFLARDDLPAARTELERLAAGTGSFAPNARALLERLAR